MTKYWLRLLLLFGAVIAVIAAIGSLLPRSYDFVSEAEIAVAPTDVYREINSLSNWHDWSQWNPKSIAGLTVQYSGSESGIGSVQTWTEPRGSGKMWITQSEPDQRIEYEMVFANFPKQTSEMELTKVGAADTKTKIRWSSSGRLPGGPFYGYFARFFSTQMGYEYEKSLLRLKEKLEGEK